MPKSLLRQPWESWVVVALGIWALYLLYGSALGLRVFFREDVTTNHEQFAEALFRLAGLIVLELGTLALIFKRRLALLLVSLGVLLYLGPWAYHYYELSASQPQPHLTWHMIKSYPVLTWQWLPLPIAMFVFTSLAIRRLSANN